MKNLSAALSAALGAPVQQPAFLLQFAFATVRRWSSFATVTWAGQTWEQAAFNVDGLAVEALRVRGTIAFNNLDDAFGPLVLDEGVQDRAVTLWGYDAAATGTADVVLLADAVGASAEVALSDVRVALRHRTEFLQAPRTYINAANGFTQLLPAGTVLRINGIDWRLERD